MQTGVNIYTGAVSSQYKNTVTEAFLEAKINGVSYDVVSGDWGIDTTGGLPDSLVNTGSGIISRTGSITIAPKTTVVDAPSHPLGSRGGGVLREGDRVVIDAVVNSGRYRRFTGRLGAVSSDFYSSLLTAEITDSLSDHLRQVVDIYPQLSDGNDYMRSSWVAHTALEYAGLGAIPPAGGRVVIHNHMQNGAVAIIGKRSGNGFGTTSGDNYGLNANTGGVTAIDSEDARAGDYVTIFGRASSNWDSEVSVTFNNGHVLKLKHVKATHQLILSNTKDGVIWSGTWTGTKTLPYLAMLVSDVDVRVWTAEEWETTMLAPTTTFANPNYPVSATGTFLIGVDVRFCESVWDFQSLIDNVPEFPVGWKASALEQERISATRGFENVTARSVIEEWADATMSVLYMDEWGKPWAVARDRLITGASQQTLKVAEEVFSGRWEAGRDGKRRGVIIKGLGVNLRGNRLGIPNTVAYQPSNKIEVELGKEDVQFIKTPDEEDWHGLDIMWKPVADLKRGIDNTLEFNDSKRGSWWGFVWQSETDSDNMRWTTKEDLSARLEKLGQRTLKMTHLITGATGGGRPKYYLSTSTDSSTKLYFANRGINMPIIRAACVAQWAEYSAQGKYSLPDRFLKEFIFESGWWLTPADAQRFADALSSELVVDRYTFDGVSVLFDPRRQVGDTETWQCVDYQGALLWEAKVLITGYKESWDANGVPTQSVDVQVKSLTDPLDGKMYFDRSSAYKTYADTTATGATYDAVYAALPGKA